MKNKEKDPLCNFDFWIINIFLILLGLGCIQGYYDYVTGKGSFCDGFLKEAGGWAMLSLCLLFFVILFRIVKK